MTVQKLTFRVGWYTGTETELTASTPLDDKYSLAVVGKQTLKQLAQSGWLSSIRGFVVINSAYEGSMDFADPAIGAQVVENVNWPDASDLDSVSRSFIAMRDLISRAIDGKPSGNILLDCNCIPRFLQMAFIGMLIRSRSVRQIDLIYQKTEYSFNGKNLEDLYDELKTRHWINSIDFSVVGVPYVEGKYMVEHRRHLIFLAGVDFYRYLSKIIELEPARIDLIIEMDAANTAESRDLLLSFCESLSISDSQVTLVPRDSFNKVNIAIRNSIKYASMNSLQPIILAAGAKPMCIAGAFQSVLESEAPIITSIPDRVIDFNKVPSGPLLLYRLSDTTSL